MGSLWLKCVTGFLLEVLPPSASSNHVCIFTFSRPKKVTYGFCAPCPSPAAGSGPRVIRKSSSDRQSLENPKGQSLSSRDASSVLWTLSLPAEG